MVSLSYKLAESALYTRLRELSVQSKSGLLGTGEQAAITAEETAIAAAGVAIDAYTLNGKALLTAALNFITKSDGSVTSLGTATDFAADASARRKLQDALGDLLLVSLH